MLYSKMKNIDLGEVSLLNKALAYHRNRPIYTPADILENKLFGLTPLTWQYKRFLQEKWYKAHSIKHIKQICNEKKCKTDSSLINLREFILVFGGEEVCIPNNEEEATNILHRGQLWLGDRVVCAKGAYSNAHQNVAHLWSFNENKTRIATGIVLTKEGIWKRHSWLILQKRPHNKIIDSTDSNFLYFGYILNHSECNEFYWENY